VDLRTIYLEGFSCPWSVPDTNGVSIGLGGSQVKWCCWNSFRCRTDEGHLSSTEQHIKEILCWIPIIYSNAWLEILFQPCAQCRQGRDIAVLLLCASTENQQKQEYSKIVILQFLIKYKVRNKTANLYEAYFAFLKIDSQVKSKERFAYAGFGKEAFQCNGTWL